MDNNILDEINEIIGEKDFHGAVFYDNLMDALLAADVGVEASEKVIEDLKDIF